MVELLGGNAPPTADTLLSDNLRIGSQALGERNRVEMNQGVTLIKPLTEEKIHKDP